MARGSLARAEKTQAASDRRIASTAWAHFVSLIDADESDHDELFVVVRPEQKFRCKFMMSLAKEFGFTPGSQSRIAIVPQRDAAAERDPIEARGRRYGATESARACRIFA